MPSIPFHPDGTYTYATVLALYLLVWLWVVRCILGREDMTSINRFLWLFVVIMVPLFGMIFYWTSRGSSTHFCSTDDAPVTPAPPIIHDGTSAKRPPLSDYIHGDPPARQP